MLFLIEYDRQTGKIVKLREYSDSDRLVAEADRLDLEVDLHNVEKEHEVVLLQAASQEALRRTHARYFEDISHLVKAS
jgi:hypothetical protein